MHFKIVKKIDQNHQKAFKMQHKLTTQNSFRFEINVRQIGDKLNNIEIANVILRTF